MRIWGACAESLYAVAALLAEHRYAAIGRLMRPCSSVAARREVTCSGPCRPNSAKLIAVTFSAGRSMPSSPETSIVIDEPDSARLFDLDLQLRSVARPDLDYRGS